jgi:hypothetical protein
MESKLDGESDSEIELESENLENGNEHEIIF